LAVAFGVVVSQVGGYCGCANRNRVLAFVAQGNLLLPPATFGFIFPFAFICALDLTLALTLGLALCLALTLGVSVGNGAEKHSGGK
jgi:hypothetical protein